jgi:hypothetical protein
MHDGLSCLFFVFFDNLCIYLIMKQYALRHQILCILKWMKHIQGIAIKISKSPLL